MSRNARRRRAASESRSLARPSSSFACNSAKDRSCWIIRPTRVTGWLSVNQRMPSVRDDLGLGLLVGRIELLGGGLLASLHSSDKLGKSAGRRRGGCDQHRRARHGGIACSFAELRRDHDDVGIWWQIFQRRKCCFHAEVRPCEDAVEATPGLQPFAWQPTKLVAHHNALDQLRCRCALVLDLVLAHSTRFSDSMITTVGRPPGTGYCDARCSRWRRIGPG